MTPEIWHAIFFIVGVIFGGLACYLVFPRVPVPPLTSNIVYVPMAKGINPNQPEVRALREQTRLYKKQGGGK